MLMPTAVAPSPNVGKFSTAVGDALEKKLARRSEATERTALGSSPRSGLPQYFNRAFVS